MGERGLRRPLIGGAVAVVRWAARRGAPEGSWLGRMMAKKPRMLVAVALANRMARVAWALMAEGRIYRDPAIATNDRRVAVGGGSRAKRTRKGKWSRDRIGQTSIMDGALSSARKRNGPDPHISIQARGVDEAAS